MSKLYVILLTENKIIDMAKSRWEIDVREEIPLETWQKISCLANSFSCNVTLHNTYKNYNTDRILL